VLEGSERCQESVHIVEEVENVDAVEVMARLWVSWVMSNAVHVGALVNVQHVMELVKCFDKLAGGRK